MKYSPHILHPRHQSWANRPRQNQQLANSDWVSNPQGPGTKRVIGRWCGWKREGNEQLPCWKLYSKCFIFGVSSNPHNNPRIQGFIYWFHWNEGQGNEIGYRKLYQWVMRCKRSKCPSADEWIHRMQSLHAVECPSAIKRNWALIQTTTWMNFEDITLH